MITCTKQLRHLLTALVLTLSALMPENAAAEKLLGLMCGKVYLSGGDVVELNDSDRIAMPVKKKQLCLVENAYSSRQKVSQRISPETVDSIVLWNATSPGHTHTLRYIPEFGWCWQLEKATGIAVYAFSPKGYHISGNGGMWTRGKSIMIVDRNGTLHRFLTIRKTRMTNSDSRLPIWSRMTPFSSVKSYRPDTDATRLLECWDCTIPQYYEYTRQYIPITLNISYYEI